VGPDADADGEVDIGSDAGVRVNGVGPHGPSLVGNSVSGYPDFARIAIKLDRPSVTFKFQVASCPALSRKTPILEPKEDSAELHQP